MKPKIDQNYNLLTILTIIIIFTSSYIYCEIQLKNKEIKFIPNEYDDTLEDDQANDTDTDFCNLSLKQKQFPQNILSNSTITAGNANKYNLSCVIFDKNVKDDDKHYALAMVIYGPNKQLKAWGFKQQINLLTQPNRIIFERYLSFSWTGSTRVTCTVRKYNSRLNKYITCQKDLFLSLKEKLDVPLTVAPPPLPATTPPLTNDDTDNDNNDKQSAKGNLNRLDSSTNEPSKETNIILNALIAGLTTTASMSSDLKNDESVDALPNKKTDASSASSSSSSTRIAILLLVILLILLIIGIILCCCYSNHKRKSKKSEIKNPDETKKLTKMKATAVATEGDMIEELDAEPKPTSLRYIDESNKSGNLSGGDDEHGIQKAKLLNN